MDSSADLKDGNIVDFFGYFVNLADLDKWKEKDKLEDIIYVVDPNDLIYHFYLTGNLSNRFELFLTTYENAIALKSDAGYILFVSSCI